jgi:hypothetical protein
MDGYDLQVLEVKNNNNKSNTADGLIIFNQES